jgi:predicted TIM-barrel fold metal-dependent hydrolase
MIVVDSHVHTSPYWFEPVEILLAQMNSNGVDKAVLVQMEGQTDNSYIIECTRRFPGRFCPVAQIDTQSLNAADTLRKLVKEGIEGIRLPATICSPCDDPLAIWRTCAELSLPVTCLGKSTEFASDEFRKVITAFPDLPIIIERLGSVSRNEPPPYATYQKILDLANYPNIYIKAGGLGEFCDRPAPGVPFPFENMPPFVRLAYNAFGPSRMMWGSNYPACYSHEGYGNTLHYLDRYLTIFCSAEDKEWIFGKTALSLFKFHESAKNIS